MNVTTINVIDRDEAIAVERRRRQQLDPLNAEITERQHEDSESMQELQNLDIEIARLQAMIRIEHLAAEIARANAELVEIVRSALAGDPIAATDANTSKNKTS